MKFQACDLKPDVPSPGRYRLKIASTREANSRAGNPIVEVILNVLDGEHAGKTVRDYFVVGGKNSNAKNIGRKRLAALFRASGVDLQPNREVDLNALESCVVNAEIGNEDFQGTTRARVRYYMSANNQAPF